MDEQKAFELFEPRKLFKFSAKYDRIVTITCWCEKINHLDILNMAAPAEQLSLAVEFSYVHSV